MQSPWKDRPADTELDIQARDLAELPSDLTWSAQAHYWHHIHFRDPARLIVIDNFNWQVGRNIYFVPALYEADVRGLMERHSRENDRQRMWVLHWGEFLQRWPRPQLQLMRAQCAT